MQYGSGSSGLKAVGFRIQVLGPSGSRVQGLEGKPANSRP